MLKNVSCKITCFSYSKNTFPHFLALSRSVQCSSFQKQLYQSVLSRNLTFGFFLLMSPFTRWNMKEKKKCRSTIPNCHSSSRSFEGQLVML